VRRVLSCAATLALAAALAAARPSLPPWAEAARAAGHAEAGGAPAIELLRDDTYAVAPDGVLTVSGRRVLWIATRDGKEHGAAVVYYRPDAEEVTELRAWLRSPSGDVTVATKADSVDLRAHPDDVFNEARMRLLDSSEDAVPGSVFAAEWTLVDRSTLAQFDWWFQQGLPVARARLTLDLPPGWRVMGAVFNREGADPVVAGATWTWELRDLPWVPDEEAAPATTSAAPWVGVTCIPPGDAPTLVPPMTSWTDVGRWMSALHDPRAVPGEAVTARARELTAGAQGSLERMRAVASFVQRISYASIQMGLGRGGGYRPHAATDVLAKGYGDCKDKSNLMRALLQAAGVAAHPVIVYHGDRGRVRPAWPSPQQFNHCIVAVAVGPDVQEPAVLEDPELGRLLFFDPTDAHGSLGTLPPLEQGSRALVCAGDRSKLVELPKAAPAVNLCERSVDATLDAAGSLVAKVVERRSGHLAALARGQWGASTPAERRTSAERLVARAAASAAVADVRVSDERAAGTLTTEIDLSVPRHAQVVGGSLLVVKPLLLPPPGFPDVACAGRRRPLDFAGAALTRDALRLAVPEGFVVDELPEPVAADGPLGSLRAEFRADGDRIVVERVVTWKEATVPPSECEAVRAFREQVERVAHARVVLARRD
jgi:hypothetical protein